MFIIYIVCRWVTITLGNPLGNREAGNSAILERLFPNVRLLSMALLCHEYDTKSVWRGGLARNLAKYSTSELEMSHIRKVCMSSGMLSIC